MLIEYLNPEKGWGFKASGSFYGYRKIVFDSKISF
jgi:hypothetical protein